VLTRAVRARSSGEWLLAVRYRRGRAIEGGGEFSPHLRSGAERCGEEQSVAVMKLGVSALGVRRGESGGRC
jgi:hypothetical protein